MVTVADPNEPNTRAAFAIGLGATVVGLAIITMFIVLGVTHTTRDDELLKTGRREQKRVVKAERKVARAYRNELIVEWNPGERRQIDVKTPTYERYETSSPANPIACTVVIHPGGGDWDLEENLRPITLLDRFNFIGLATGAVFVLAGLVGLINVLRRGKRR